MIIDSHQHVVLPTTKQIEKMDTAGVDKAILFGTAPHPEKASNYFELKKEMDSLYRILAGDNTKEANISRLQKNLQELLEALRKYPNRFYGFGAVPLGLTQKETTFWIEKHILGNKLKGIGEFTPGSSKQVQQLENIFLALEETKPLPIWVHTFNPVSLDGLKMLMDMTRKHPNIPVIYGHMGGSNWTVLLEFALDTPNAYVDLSAIFSTLAAKMVIEALPEKCLFSSDTPYGDVFFNRQLVEYVSPSQNVANMVLGENILKLLEK